MPTQREYDNNQWYSIDENPIARSGILEYLGSSISPSLVPDKIYRVYRSDEELNNPETLKSANLIPWLARHAMIGPKHGVKPESIGIQGYTGDSARFDKTTKFLVNKIKAVGSSLMSGIDKGIKALSIGMDCDWIIESGITPDGEPYDVKQINIRLNHLASVPEGRAGSSVAVMDSSDMITFAMDELNFKKTDSNEENVMDVKGIKAAIAALSPEDKAALVASLAPKAEDAPEEEKPAAEKPADKDPEESAPKGAMDAAVMKSISDLTKTVESLQGEVKSLKGSAMDEVAIIKSINEKNALVEKLKPIIGAFDHADMSKQQVAEYAVKHKSIAMDCTAGNELAAINGFLQGRKEPVYIEDSGALDGADLESSDNLKKAGF